MLTPELSRITITLRAREGESLAQHIAPFVSLGATVLVGRHGAVVAAASEGDLIEQAHQLEQQLVLAEAAIKRGVRPGCGLRIDDWIATVANARRYEFLRDHALQTGNANVPMVRSGIGDPYRGDALDSLMDHTMGKYPEVEGSPGAAPLPGGTLKAEEATIDPRDLFIRLNPIGTSGDGLAKGRSGFVDGNTQDAFQLFLAGYTAAQGVQP